MDKNAKKEAAAALEKIMPELLNEFTAVLAKRGHKLRVVSFRLGAEPDASLLNALAGTPCPTRCVVLPDGSIECRPEC